MQKAADEKMLHALAGVVPVTSGQHPRSGAVVGLMLVLCGLALIAWGIMGDLRTVVHQGSNTLPAQTLSPAGRKL